MLRKNKIMLSELHAPYEIPCATPQTLAFIKENAKSNPNNAALKAPRNAGIDVTFAVNQIAGKQIAQQKLPKWASCEEIIYPAHISMEQCSSQATAQYKANIARKLLSELHEENTSSTLVDLTGGFGVDCTIMSEVFDSAICIEQQTELSSIAQHNMKSLGLSHVACYNNNSLDALNHISNVTMIYVDPARRNTQGARTYAIEDCTPDVLALKGSMLAKAQIVMIKLSPMLDWHKTVSDFGGNVSQVHIVAHNNECKELLLIIDAHIHNQLSIHCVNDNQRTTIKAFYDTVTKQVSTRAAQLCDSTETRQSNDLRNWQQWAQYVYEPNAAVMKAGCFEYLEEQYKIQEIGPNSHVCIARDYYADFPGKVWKIESTCSMNKRDIKRTLGDLTHANIVTRNFPMPAEVLKKRLHLQDGGNIRLIATTDSNKDHVIIRAGSVQQ